MFVETLGAAIERWTGKESRNAATQWTGRELVRIHSCSGSSGLRPGNPLAAAFN